MAAPKRSPRHLRILTGTLQPCRDDVPELAPLLVPDGVPPPPWMINLEARREFERLAEVMTRCQLLHTGNLGPFAQMCALHGALIAAWASDTPPSAAMLAAYRRLSNDLMAQRVPTAPTPAGKPNSVLMNGAKGRR